MTFNPFTIPPAFSLVAQTPLAGVALVNGTPIIISYQLPNDGLMHRFMVFSQLIISSTETGGLVQAVFTDFQANARSNQIFAANLAAGFATNFGGFISEANTLISVKQNSALTLGAATIYSEIWAA